MFNRMKACIDVLSSAALFIHLVACSTHAANIFFPAVSQDKILILSKFDNNLDGWNDAQCRTPTDGYGVQCWRSSVEGAQGVADLKCTGLPKSSGTQKQAMLYAYHQMCRKFVKNSTSDYITLIVRFRTRGKIGFVFREPDITQIARLNLGYFTAGHYSYSYQSPREVPVLPPTFDTLHWNQLVFLVDRVNNKGKIYNMSEADGQWECDQTWYAFNPGKPNVAWGSMNIDNEARGGNVLVDHVMLVEGAYVPEGSVPAVNERASTGESSFQVAIRRRAGVNVLSVDSRGGCDNSTVRLYEPGGRLRYQKDFPGGGIHECVLANPAAGAYVIQIIRHDRNETTSLIRMMR